MDRGAGPGKAARLWLPLGGFFFLSQSAVCHLDTSSEVAQRCVAEQQGQMMRLCIVASQKECRRQVSSFEVDRCSLDDVS